MIKKIYKHNGILIQDSNMISDDVQKHKLYIYILNHYKQTVNKQQYTKEYYIKEYYKSLGFIYD
jgi:hypothetical protein